MLIIFGVRNTVRLLATAVMQCSRCGQTGAHRLIRIRRWFTLFFIPVIPLGGRLVQTCLLCGLQLKVTPAQAEQVVALSGQQQAQWESQRTGQLAAPPGALPPPGPAAPAVPPAAPAIPAGATRSPDGRWWWTGEEWRAVPPGA